MATYEGADGARQLANKLLDVPTEVRQGLRPAIKSAAESIRGDAASRASWSTRIPRAISVTTKFAGRGVGVSVIVSSATAPHARPYEGITGNATFRHPLNYPSQSTWVLQATRPFLLPAAEANRDQAIRDIEAVVDQALARV